MPEKPFVQKRVVGVKRISETHSQLLSNSHAMAIVARHAERTKPEKKLNDKGIVQAYWGGTKLPANMELVTKATPAARGVHTLELARQGYKKEGKKEFDFDSVAKEYSLDVLGEIDSYDQPIEELSAVGKEYFRAQLPEILARIKAQKVGDKKPLYLNVSHEGIELAIFSALGLVKTKDDLEKITPKKRATKEDPTLVSTQRFTEGVLFYFLKDGRVVLSYRKQKFDVTSAITRILNDPFARQERKQFYLKLAQKYPFAKDYYTKLAGSF
jgi:hypothetical protein